MFIIKSICSFIWAASLLMPGSAGRLELSSAQHLLQLDGTAPPPPPIGTTRTFLADGTAPPPPPVGTTRTFLADGTAPPPPPIGTTPTFLADGTAPPPPPSVYAARSFVEA